MPAYGARAFQINVNRHSNLRQEEDMTSVSKKARESRVPLVLRGLTERELSSLYELATIRKINAGEVLFREGDVDTSLWFIVEGSLRIEKRLNGQTRELAVLLQGNSVEEINPRRNQRRTATATAVEPSTLMELEELSLNALSSRIESSIYRNLIERIGDHLGNLIEKERELQDKNKCLVSYLRDYHRSKNDDYARSEIIQRIIKGFPRLPMHSSQLAARLLDENVSTGEVVDLIRFDPSLVSIVLKTVNSAYYNLQRKVSDIQRAVLLLGFNQVYQVIMSEGLRSIMPDGPEFQELLFHSVLVSLLSFEIAQICHLKRGERHGTIGLLHDIGKSIILLLKREYPKLKGIVDIVGHSRIGSLLLKEWNIPEVICTTLEYQGYPEFSPPEEIPEERRENVAVLYLAHLCEGYLQGKWKGDSSSPFHREYLGLLNLSDMPMQEFARGKILPSMTKKLNTFPENVRRFLVESESRLTEEGRP